MSHSGSLQFDDVIRWHRSGDNLDGHSVEQTEDRLWSANGEGIRIIPIIRPLQPQRLTFAVFRV